MRIWQVLLLGEGFQVEGVKSNCEITGFVEAEGVEAAIEKACAIATRAHPELGKLRVRFRGQWSTQTKFRSWVPILPTR